MQSRLTFFIILLALLFIQPALPQSSAFSVVNAAAYSNAVAPDSFATIFGSGLASSTATATLDSSGQLPTELASTRVEINGVAAPLFYVSPTQINLVIPAGLSSGTATVLVRSTANSTTKSGTALIRSAAPGIFTLDASGTGAGSILNAVTYAGTPFLVQTPENGSDPRTRLAVYGTGLRHADAVTAAAQDSSGNRYTLTIEYAGAAPGYFGLDQVNLLLPPDLDGAGAVSLSISADYYSANIVTFQVNLLPASSLQLGSLSLSPTFLNAGNTSTLTVALNGTARAGGLSVALRSDSFAAQVASQITVPQGKASAQTTVSTSAVNSTQNATITAQAGAVTQTATLAIDPASTVAVSSVALSASSVPGGRTLSGTVNLSGNAPLGGVNAALASDDANVTVPGIVTVPFGNSSAGFAVATRAVTALETATLTATLGHGSVTTTLTLLPPVQLTLSADTVASGNSITGTITLAEAAPFGGANISMKSSDASVQVPSVVVPAGQTTQTFTLTTSAVSATRTVSVTATYLNASQSATLTVNPPAAVAISTFSISPSYVAGGSTAQATVTLTGAAGFGGVQVTLESSNPLTAVASPKYATIAQGQTSAVFVITTTRFPAAVTFTATANGSTKTATLTVQ